MIAMHADLLLRVLAGTMLGAVIGYERRIHGRPAGLRTHLLMALAASVFMVVSTNFVYFQHYVRRRPGRPSWPRSAPATSRSRPASTSGGSTRARWR
ncbi:MAG TPA: MgtC/SapB family protein [Candidatus Dormibacteraeota bacterium]|nr:MgtC/SapB family protein [Candidatus Dormibacteraeota bacterium]